MLYFACASLSIKTPVSAIAVAAFAIRHIVRH